MNGVVRVIVSASARSRATARWGSGEPVVRVIDPTIQLQWSWIRGYGPWIKELKLGYAEYGLDTGLTDRQGTPIHIGDLLSGFQERPCPCTCATQTDPGTPQEFAAAHGLTPPTWAPRPASILTPPPPRKDPWNSPPNPPPLLPKWTTRTYFVYRDPASGGFIGRTFFQCEQQAPAYIPPKYIVCSPEEKAEMVLTSFDEVVVIGDIYTTPELFRLNPAKDFAAGSTYGALKLWTQEHFK